MPREAFCYCTDVIANVRAAAKSILNDPMRKSIVNFFLLEFIGFVAETFV